LFQPRQRVRATRRLPIATPLRSQSGHGTVYDKEDNRYAVYRTRMQRYGQPE
jgi:hypothetical protein